MLQLTAQHRLLIAVNFIDFRCGIDRLVSLCRLQLSDDPFSGAFFVFRNRAKTSIKILVFDGNGFWLCQKRFSEGKLKWWPKSESESVNLKAAELQVLLAQGIPEKASIPEDWKKL
jgi:transposase